MSNSEEEIENGMLDIQKGSCDMIDYAFNTMSKYIPQYRRVKPMFDIARDNIKKKVECTPEKRIPVTYIQEVTKWDKVLKDKGMDGLPPRIRVALNFTDKKRA